MGKSIWPKELSLDWALEEDDEEGDAIMFEEFDVIGCDEAGCVWKH